MKINSKITTMLSCLVLGATSLSAQEANFTLTVNIAKPYPGFKAFLQYRTSPEATTVDSAAYVNDKFEFKGKTLRPQHTFLYLAPGNKGYAKYNVTLARIPVYLEGGNIIITSTTDLTGARLSGTPLNVAFQGYTDVVDSFKPRLDSLRAIYGKANQQKDTATLRKVTPRFAEYDIDVRKAEVRYFLAHANSPVSLDWLKKSYNLSKQKSQAAELFGKMGKTVKNSDNGKEYSKLLAKTQSVEVGLPAPNFTANNIKKEPVSLSSFRGKYVLLDFWASWCGPCRAENPNVLKAYNAYKDKNFTVVGFSIDSSEMGWEKAVAQDALPWTQLSGFGQKGDELPALLYGITAIPSNFLIDPQGKIIAMDLRGEELEKALAKFIKG